jgi:hypothetical protein
MISQKLLISVTFAAVVVCAACGQTRIPEGSCQTVSFPERWQIKNSNAGVVTQDGKPYEGMVHPDESDPFEIRRLDGQLAIAIKSSLAANLDEELYSHQKYSLTLRDSVTLSPISDEQWNSAKPLPNDRRYVKVCPVIEAHCDAYYQPLSYKNRTFQMSGQHATSPEEAALRSWNDKWLALQSYDGSIDKASSYLPNSGMFYVDVFNTQTAEKRFTVKIYVTSGGVTGPASPTRWISDSVLLLDIFRDKQKLVLCDASKQAR